MIKIINYDSNDGEKKQNLYLYFTVSWRSTEYIFNLIKMSFHSYKLYSKLTYAMFYVKSILFLRTQIFH